MECREWSNARASGGTGGPPYFAPDSRYSWVARRWAAVIDTTIGRGFTEPQAEFPAGEKLPLAERSFVLLRRMA